MKNLLEKNKSQSWLDNVKVNEKGSQMNITKEFKGRNEYENRKNKKNIKISFEK